MRPIIRSGNDIQPRLRRFARGIFFALVPAGWITDVPGLSRADQLKAIGNGVCPQQAEAAIAQLLPQIERIEVSE